MSLLLLLSISPFYLDKCQVEMQRRVCIIRSQVLGSAMLFYFVGVPHCSYDLEQSTIIVGMNAWN